MKSILMSIRPEWVAKILNGEKTIEIRKKFPSDYVGWVYIYVTKGKQYLSSNGLGYYVPKKYEKYMGNWNGKVAARFWCDNVEEIYGGSFNQFDIYSGCYFIGKECPLYFEQKSCLTQSELKAYLGDKQGYAIHITNVQPFDKPKEIKEFGRVVLELRFFNGGEYYEEEKYPLTRAPQSWCYVEI